MSGASWAELAAPRRAEPVYYAYTSLLCDSASTLAVFINEIFINLSVSGGRGARARRGRHSARCWITPRRRCLRLIAHLPSANTSVICVLLWPPVQIWLDRRVPSEGGRAPVVECTLSPSSFRDSLRVWPAPAVSPSYPTVSSFRRCCSSLFKLAGLPNCPIGQCHVFLRSKRSRLWIPKKRK